MKPSIVVVGSCMTDLTSYTQEFPKPGETICGTSFIIGFGGKGANQCIAAARLGAKTAMVARVGNDSFGENYIKNFKNNKVNGEHVHAVEGVSTGVATIVVNGKGENSIITVGGANQEITADDVMQAEDLIKDSQVVICQGEINEAATKQALILAKKHKVKTLVNAAPPSSGIDEEIFLLSDILCVNEMEATFFTGIQLGSVSEAKNACNSLIKRGCEEVILTMGAKGALFVSSDSSAHIPAPRVPTVVDTTGAGDAFVGALAYFLASKPELGRAEMIERACKIASVSVQYKGTQSSFPHKDSLKHILDL